MAREWISTGRTLTDVIIAKSASMRRVFQSDGDGWRRPTFRHELAAAPTLAPDRLADLASRVGTTAPAADGSEMLGLTVSHLELEPSTRDLIADCARELREAFPGLMRTGVAARLQIAPPGHSEPLVMSPHICFSMQLRGQRTVAFGRGGGQAYDLERLYAGDNSVEVSPDRFALRAGDGIRNPGHASWASVVTGDEPSVAVNLEFLTRHAQRQAEVHRVNNLLRLAGVNARPAGQSFTLDELKSAVGRAQRRAQRIVHQLRPVRRP
jgi:hypothetical protein